MLKMECHPEYKSGCRNHKEIHYTILKVQADQLILQTMWNVVALI